MLNSMQPLGPPVVRGVPGRQRVLVWGLLCAGCGFYGDLYDVSAAGLNRSEHELVASVLGVLDTEPPPEPTNVFADDPAAAALGQQYFFDPAYSGSGQISCASCHDPATGFQDRRGPAALGLVSSERHVPSCLNVAAGRDGSDTNWQFWDGRSDSLWSQALGPPENPAEMGGTRATVAYMVYDRYRDAHESVFGPLPQLRDDAGRALFPTLAAPGDPAWEALSLPQRDDLNRVYVEFGKAVAAYERRLMKTSSAFDVWYDEAILADEPSDALTDQQLRGLRLFVGKANCVACHNGPNFTDQDFHNLGLRHEGKYAGTQDYGRAEGIDELTQAEWNCTSQWSDHPDKSRCAVLELRLTERAEGAFKTPTLRNISETAPYMHTGQFDTLEEVVRFYDQGGHDDGFVGTPDQRIQPLSLSETEIQDLVAFLTALTGDALPLSLTTPPILPGQNSDPGAP